MGWGHRRDIILPWFLGLMAEARDGLVVALTSLRVFSSPHRANSHRLPPNHITARHPRGKDPSLPQLFFLSCPGAHPSIRRREERRDRPSFKQATHRLGGRVLGRGWKERGQLPFRPAALAVLPGAPRGSKKQ